MFSTTPYDATPIRPPVIIDSKPPIANVSLPTRLEIARINVKSKVEHVGITSEGDMAIGDDIKRVGWYKAGPRPGEKGSAVIAGHYGWRYGRASVFNELSSLKAGDEISVYDKKNNSVAFIVQKIKKYQPEADAAEVFRSNDGKARLNLITCVGTWNENLQTYSERLVVFTNKKL